MVGHFYTGCHSADDNNVMAQEVASGVKLAYNIAQAWYRVIIQPFLVQVTLIAVWVYSQTMKQDRSTMTPPTTRSSAAYQSVVRCRGVP